MEDPINDLNAFRKLAQSSLQVQVPRHDFSTIDNVPLQQYMAWSDRHLFYRSWLSVGISLKYIWLSFNLVCNNISPFYKCYSNTGTYELSTFPRHPHYPTPGWNTGFDDGMSKLPLLGAYLMSIHYWFCTMNYIEDNIYNQYNMFWGSTLLFCFTWNWYYPLKGLPLSSLHCQDHH